MKPFRILVADDHDLMRRGIKTLLESHPGWEVCGEAKTGREAVDKAEELKPDIIILDISMPDLNGVEAARRIRKSSASTEILILSIHYSDQLIREIVDAGVRGYIVKSDSDRERLTSREREIVQLLAEGKSSKEVAASLGISVKTAETHRANIMRKLDLHSVSELVRYAVRNQIIEP